MGDDEDLSLTGQRIAAMSWAADVPRLPSESMPLADAAGLVLSEDVVSPQALPRFDNAAMDGFAVRASDLAAASATNPVTLLVTGASMAGAVSGVALGPKSAVRIATGATLPAGTDAVVRLEEATDSGEAVTFETPQAVGTNIRRRGEDLAQGDVLLRAGLPVGPGQLAAAAAAGLVRLPVHGRPRVSVLVTGDELVAGGEVPGEAQIHDSIGPALLAVLANMGCRPVLRGPIADDPDAVTRALLEEARSADAVITVGGISVGPRDHVRTAVESVGGRVMQVDIRPGKPFGMGRAEDATLFALPGNPVSALVAFEVFVRPALATMMGRRKWRVVVEARLTEPFTQRTGRLHLVRAWLDREGGEATVRPLGPHGAGSLGSLAGANAWMVVPPEIERLEEGAEVETWPMLPS